MVSTRDAWKHLQQVILGVDSWFAGMWCAFFLSSVAAQGGLAVMEAIVGVPEIYGLIFFGFGDPPIYGRIMIGLGGAVVFSGELVLIVRWLCTIDRASRLKSKHPPPLPILMALPTPDLPGWLRPVGSLWCFAHFIAGPFWIVWVNALQSEKMIHEIPDYFMASLAVAYVGNTFLLLAVSTLWNDTGAIRRVWRWRFVIDLLVALVVFLVFAVGSLGPALQNHH